MPKTPSDWIIGVLGIVAMGTIVAFSYQRGDFWYFLVGISGLVCFCFAMVAHAKRQL